MRRRKVLTERIVKTTHQHVGSCIYVRWTQSAFTHLLLRLRHKAIAASSDRSADFTTDDKTRLLIEAVLSAKMSREAWDGFQSLPGFDELPPGTFRTHHKVKTALNRASTVEVDNIHCCVNNCRLFYGSYAEDTECICTAPRYKADVSCLIYIELSLHGDVCLQTLLFNDLCSFKGNHTP